MKFSKSIIDCIFCMLILYGFVFLLHAWSAKQIPIIQPQGNLVKLTPDYAFLRGQIQATGNKIINWKNNKNIAHWRFLCQEEGDYEVSVNHDKVSKSLSISSVCSGNSSEKTMTVKSSQTVIMTTRLNAGEHSLALYFAELPKKSKVPAIRSIYIKKIN